MDEKFYEIFRAGNYPQRSVSEEDIKAIAENYDPSFQEAPISIFHYGDRFAYGWIKELKAEGKKLMASFKDVTDELKEYVAKKMLKNHSIELYEDLNGKGLYLKSLAMLGSEAPAVKGMNPIQFQEGEANEYRFTDVPAFAADFTAAHFEKKAADLAAELNAEKQKVQTFASEKEQLAFAQRKEKFEAFLHEKTEAGQLEPKLREQALALFTQLDSVTNESGESAVDLFKEILSAFKKQIRFGEEFVDGQGDEGDLTAHELAAKITEYQEEQRQAGRTVSYSDALNHVKKNQKGS